MKMNLPGEKKLAGCCGVYCGLCPRFQSPAKSRCPGCKQLSLTISCRLFNCCVKQKGFVTCAECQDFPCAKFGAEFFQYDLFVTHQVCRPNLARIREAGLERWLDEQTQRRAALEHLLTHFDEGRSRSFCCLAAALMPPKQLAEAVEDAERGIAAGQVAPSDFKAKARILRAALQESAARTNVDLRLRKKPE